MLAGDSSRDSRCLRQAMTCARVTVRSAAGSRSPVKADELRNVDLVGAPGFRIGDVGEPFDFGGNIGEVAVLGRR